MYTTPYLYFQLEFLYHINRLRAGCTGEGMFVVVVLPLFVNDGVHACDQGHGASLGGFDGVDVVVVCVHACACTCVHTRVHTCALVCACGCMCAHGCLCVHMGACVHACAKVHTSA